MSPRHGGRRFTIRACSPRCYHLWSITPSFLLTVHVRPWVSQLRCSGVLAAVKVSQAGFPTRIPFSELLARYALLLPVSSKQGDGYGARAGRPRMAAPAHSGIEYEMDGGMGPARSNSSQVEQQRQCAALLRSLQVVYSTHAMPNHRNTMSMNHGYQLRPNLAVSCFRSILHLS